MRIVILVVSFILESAISNFFPVNSLFVSLFSLTEILAIYPLFEDEKRKYFLAAFLLGLAYDLIYTDTIIFEAFLFLFIAYLVTVLRTVLSDNFLNSIVILLVCIVAYRTINYFSLIITGNLDFNLHNYLASIYKSIILNVIYCLALNPIVNFIKRRKKKSYLF